jgi:hypothetical protein
MLPDRIRQLAADERLARDVGFWWGLAEGLFFFIVPDVYISVAALFSLRAGAIAWLASIAGSMVAVCLVYLLAQVPEIDYRAFLASLPGISQGLIEQVGGRMARDGLPYTPLLVLGGVPLKLYAAQAFALGLPLGAVLLWTVFARIVRIAPSFIGAAAVRLLARRSIDARPLAWSALATGFWLVFYVFYFLHMGRG